MSVEFPKMQQIFLSAVEQYRPEEWEDYLGRACAGDDELRNQVRLLLKAHVAAGSVPGAAGRPHDPTVSYQRAPETGGAVIGPYKLVETIGEGGMGTVWMAQQTEPVKRLVALKLIKVGMDSNQVLARFEAERQALALMDHPHIAKVLDAGTTGSGLPYFVMELVKGLPITRYCDEHHLTPRQRLELFIPVCQAVQHAHQKGIIHRDLKPSNVLVALYDGQPVPKVIDFGVAKATGQSLTDRTLITGFGAIVGTVEYMSPEQAGINQLDIDTRSDIYSLGVLLYELLAGSPPFSRKDLEQAGLLEMLRVIREQEPSKPSTKLSTADGLPTLAANRGTEPARLTRLVRGDLDWIVMKALDKDRNRRYETANAFAADVQHFLDDEPVLARPVSAAYRFRKLAKRHKSALVAVTLIVFTLIIGTVVSAWQAIRATRAEGDASEQRDLANRRATEAAVERDKANIARREAETQSVRADAERTRAEERAVVARKNQYVANMTFAVQAWNRNDLPTVLARLIAERPTPGLPDVRTFAWYYLWGECDRDRLTIHAHDAGVTALAFSPDGRSLATGSLDHSVKLWRTVDGREERLLSGHTKEINAVVFSPDGLTLASAADDQAVRLWNTETGQVLGQLMGYPGHVTCVAFAPGGQMVCTGGSDATIRFWSVSTLEQDATLEGHTDEVDEIRFSPDGKLLASCADDGTVRIWDVAARAELATLRGHVGHVTCLAFSPDGNVVASCGRDLKIKLWNVTEKREKASFAAHTARIRSLAFSPDGAMLVTASDDKSVKFWDVDHQREVHTFRGHTEAAISSDGASIATCGGDGNVKLWAMPSPGRMILPAHNLRSGEKSGNGAYTVAFSPDSAVLASGGWDSFVKLWDVASGLELAKLTAGHITMTLCVAFSPDGLTLAAAGDGDKFIRLWDVASHQVRLELRGHTRTIQKVEFSPDGRRLASCGDDQTVRIWDPVSGTELAVLRGHTAPIDSLAFTRDGTVLASGGRDSSVRLWDPNAFRELDELKSHDGHVRSLAISPDGKTLAHGIGRLGVILIWDLPTRRLRSKFTAHTEQVESLAFSPDGAFLMSGSNDATARLWDLQMGLEVSVLRGHTGQIDGIAIAPDGQTLATASGDKTVRLWKIHIAAPPDSELDNSTDFEAGGGRASRGIHVKPQAIQKSR